MIKLGIGVTTYNRAASLTRTLDGLLRHTRHPYTLIVADDGSPDQTLDLLRSGQIPHVAGPNRGIAWNKNRALFHLYEVARCDVVLLLEDDVAPRHDGWEAPWIEAAQRWGHVNLAGPWFANLFESGSGTTEDPVLSTVLTGQCSGFSRSALAAAGYMDTRFGRYGYEHCDHSERLLKAGFGGQADPRRYYLITSDLAISGIEEDYRSELGAGARVYDALREDTSIYRPAWRNRDELQRLLGEVGGTVVYDTPAQLSLWRARAKLLLQYGRHVAGGFVPKRARAA